MRPFAWQGYLMALPMIFLHRRTEAAARPLFEPTDLEMEDPGVLDVDLQFGTVRGQAPWRLVVPDIEVDFGLSRNVEFDVDAAYAIEGPESGRFTFDHPAPDNLWVAAKLGLYDTKEERAATAWAVGAQLGPKLPVAPASRGIGYEALLLVGRTWGWSHLVLNLGGLVDPGAAVSARRPAGIEGGLDLLLKLGNSSLSVTGELAGVHFFSADSDQLHATAGVTWATSDYVDVSVVGLAGFLSGGDRVGVLFGISPKFALWK